jgi:hypothetical protein
MNTSGLLSFFMSFKGHVLVVFSLICYILVVCCLLNDAGSDSRGKMMIYSGLEGMWKVAVMS